jgi:hypothetical protein
MSDILIRKSEREFYLGKKRINSEEVLSILNANPTAKVVHGLHGDDITLSVKTALEGKLWSLEEKQLIAENFSKFKIKALKSRFFPRKTVGQIRHMASSMSLTVDKDVWSVRDESILSKLRKARVSFEEIAEVLNRSVSSCQQKAYKIGATYPEGHTQLDTLSAEREKFESIPGATKGRVAEVMVAVQFALNGFEVYQPFYPQSKVDLLAYKDGIPYKIQVKSASWVKDTSRYRVSLMVKNPRTHQRVCYDKSDVDYFVVVCLGSAAYYVIPYDKVSGVNELNLYPHRTVSGQSIDSEFEKYRDAYAMVGQSGV